MVRMINVLGHLETRRPEPPEGGSTQSRESGVGKDYERAFPGQSLLQVGRILGRWRRGEGKGKDNGLSQWNMVSARGNVHCEVAQGQFPGEGVSIQ